ncbi:hypothetical protein OAQ81_03890 [Candidatus Thioglobus sp.]|nr:hypothetical protein [Candidatus Thioglobus sp.]
MDRALTTDFDYFAKSLYVEAELFLGDEFCKLPLRVRTGYIKAFYYNQSISRNNRHIDHVDSFTMDAKTTKRLFGKRQLFNDVNHNGYGLRPKNGKYGPIDSKYVICKENHDLYNECKPTNWLIKSRWARQTSKHYGILGHANGYALSPKITELISIWQVKLDNGEYKDTETALIDGKLNNIYDNEELKKGAIVRDKTAIDESINVNLMVDINIVSLNMYKELLTRLDEYFDANKIEGIVRGSKRWKEVEKEVKGWPLETEEEGRREAQGGSTETLGVPKRHFHDHVAVKHLFDKDIEKQQVLDQLGEVNKILNYTRELNAPIMPVIYEEKSTGRYFAMHAALEGCYEYDIEAAHQNILLEVFHRKEIDFKKLDVIRDYIQNKNSIRDKLAKDLDIHKSLVKRVITGLTYGAKLVNNKKTSLYKDCNGDHKVINRVIANEWLKSLATVFKETSFHLVNDKDDITNAVGINRPIKSKGKVEGVNKSQAVAHILQGHEREVVDAVISHYDRNDIVLLLHDCVVFKGKLSSHEMSQIVDKEAGFDLSFKEEKY